MAESSLEETITRGKGPGGIPVWGYGAGIAVLFILFMYLRNRKAAKNQTAIDPNAANANGTGTFDPNAIDPATGLTFAQEGPAGYGLPAGPIGGYLANNPTFPGYPVGAPAQGLPAPVTNQQWSRLAFDELVAKGDDPSLVGNALSKFLAGQPLSNAEKAIVSLAETIFGAPPEGLIPINAGGTTPPVTPPPASQPPVTPPPVTPVQVQPPGTADDIGPGKSRSHTTITAGETVAPVLLFFGTTQQQLDAWNPGITYYNSPVGRKFGVTRTVIVNGGKGW